LLVVTANALTQRVLTPFRIRALTRRLAEGERVERDTLISLLSANGYQRTDAVHDAGEFAVRGSIVDLYPAGETTALRLDFFGDEIETMRRFDPCRPKIDRERPEHSRSCPRRKPCSTRRASSAFAPDIARCSGQMRLATRFIRR
jgi:transcription-repair coupling factor (superfamily II helicase)